MAFLASSVDSLREQNTGKQAELPVPYDNDQVVIRTTKEASD